MEANNPYKAPDAEILKPLGSLSQAARGNELKQAQRILIVIGVLTTALNGFMLFNLPNEVQNEIQQNQIAPADVEDVRNGAMVFGFLIYGSVVLLGLLFVVFGLIIKKFPVPITITSLTLYILATAIFGLLNPMTLAQGLIMKVIIIFCLIRAIKAARSFEAHARDKDLADGLLE